MPEVGAEHTHIVAAAVAQANHVLGRHSIGNSEARREVVPIILFVAIQPNAALASHAINALLEIGKSSLIFAVNILGEVNLPTQAIVHG